MAKLQLKSKEFEFMAEGNDKLVLDSFMAFTGDGKNIVGSAKGFAEPEFLLGHRTNVRTTVETETTWENIAAAAADGTLSDILKSGDYIPFTLKNGDEVGLDIGRDESGRTYFIFHNTMKERHHMNPDFTNKGGWRDSDMRSYVNDKVYNLLPEEIKAIIKPTTIVQVLDGERIETEDNLFCLSATQVFGKDEYWESGEPEDTQIDIFRDPHTRSKVWLGADDGSASWWWLRSAYDHGHFNNVNSGGSYDDDYACTSGAVALGFCIENQ